MFRRQNNCTNHCNNTAIRSATCRAASAGNSVRYLAAEAKALNDMGAAAADDRLGKSSGGAAPAAAAADDDDVFEAETLKGCAEYFKVSLDDRSPKCCNTADADNDAEDGAAACFEGLGAAEALLNSDTSCGGSRLDIDSASSRALHTAGILLDNNKRGVEFNPPRVWCSGQSVHLQPSPSGTSATAPREKSSVTTPQASSAMLLLPPPPPPPPRLLDDQRVASPHIAAWSAVYLQQVQKQLQLNRRHQKHTERISFQINMIRHAHVSNDNRQIRNKQIFTNVA